MGILKASRQAEQGVQLEFANRLRAALGSRLTIIDAADHRLLRGPAFYDLFIDRSRWPALIREGYERATRTFDALRRAPRVAASTKSRTVAARGARKTPATRKAPRADDSRLHPVVKPSNPPAPIQPGGA